MFLCVCVLVPGVYIHTHAHTCICPHTYVCANVHIPLTDTCSATQMLVFLCTMSCVPFDVASVCMYSMHDIHTHTSLCSCHSTNKEKGDYESSICIVFHTNLSPIFYDIVQCYAHYCYANTPYYKYVEKILKVCALPVCNALITT